MIGGPRPGRLVVVAGTGTEVGKTWVTARLAERLVGAGSSVAARKPAQSTTAEEEAGAATDADVLARATGGDPLDVCPTTHRYPVPLAPPMAADVLGRPTPRLADLLGALSWPDPPVDVGLVEPAGGVRSPLADDADTVDLCRALDPDLVVLVADAGLGTINAVLTAVPPVADWPLAVVLNRADPAVDLHVRNLSWLRDRSHLDVVTTVAELADRVTRPRSAP